MMLLFRSILILKTLNQENITKSLNNLKIELSRGFVISVQNYYSTIDDKINLALINGSYFFL